MIPSWETLKSAAMFLLTVGLFSMTIGGFLVFSMLLGGA